MLHQLTTTATSEAQHYIGAGFNPNAMVPAKKAVPLLREGFAIPITSAPLLAIESRPALPISEADRRFEGGAAAIPTRR